MENLMIIEEKLSHQINILSLMFLVFYDNDVYTNYKRNKKILTLERKVIRFFNRVLLLEPFL